MWAEEMAPWVEHLLRKQGDVSLNPQSPRTQLEMAVHPSSQRQNGPVSREYMRGRHVSSGLHLLAHTLMYI